MALLQRFIDNIKASEQPRRVLVVSLQDEPKWRAWADQLRERVNIVEVRSSQLIEPGRVIVMLHPDDLKIEFPSPTLRQPRRPLRFQDVTGY